MSDSKGGRFTALTEDILSFQPVMISPAIDWGGITTITLQGFKPAAHHIESHLNRLRILINLNSDSGRT